MKKRLIMLWVIFTLVFVPRHLYAQQLGPAYNYSDLLYLVNMARQGDTILVSGRIQADETIPLISRENVSIRSVPEQKAIISGVHILDSNLSFSDVDLVDSLDIHGSSKVMLESNVNVYGNRDAAIQFKGNGELIITPSCTVTATDGANGISIEHEGGSFYAALEGTVTGGDSDIGGAGVIVSPLHKEGMLLIGGNIFGGNGTDIGGNAVNLYDIGGNAYISVIGSMQGGIGSVGGNGLQIISPRDTSNIGIIGRVEGGEGDVFGGNAVVVLNAEDRSSIALSGALIGGNTSSASSDPGQSLLLVGNGVLDHMYTEGCLLEDGQILEEAKTMEPPVVPISQSADSKSVYYNEKQSYPVEVIDTQTEYEEAVPIGMMESAESVESISDTADVSDEENVMDSENMIYTEDADLSYTEEVPEPVQQHVPDEALEVLPDPPSEGVIEQIQQEESDSLNQQPSEEVSFQTTEESSETDVQDQQSGISDVPQQEDSTTNGNETEHFEEMTDDSTEQNVADIVSNPDIDITEESVNATEGEQQISDSEKSLASDYNTESADDDALQEQSDKQQLDESAEEIPEELMDLSTEKKMPEKKKHNYEVSTSDKDGIRS